MSDFTDKMHQALL